MHTLWFKNAKDKEKRLKEVQSYRNAFEELVVLLEENYKKKPSVREYSSPGWVQQQIAVNEYNQALDDLLSLLKHIKD